MAANLIKIASNEGKEFLVPRNVVILSKTIKTLLETMGLDDMDTTNEAPIPLQNVDSKTLAKCIEWCKHHHEDPEEPEEPSSEESKALSTWDTNFMKVSDSEVFEIILAANYLDIPGLLNVGCKTVANGMSGLSVEQIRTKYGVVNDFSAEEEEQIRKENAWCED